MVKLEDIKKAVDVVQRAQRNYDRSKSIPKEDLETMIYAAEHSSSKQSETHYELHIYTNDIVEKLYKKTKEFALFSPEDLHEVFSYEGEELKTKEEHLVHNSQMFGSAVFVYFLTDDNVRNGRHLTGKILNIEKSKNRLKEQQYYSIGISVGQLLLTAGLLGYKTGICSAFNSYDEIKKMCGTKHEPKLMIGIGYENEGVNRRLAQETLNKDVPEKYRNGLDIERWMFPTFKKVIKVKINDRYRED